MRDDEPTAGRHVQADPPGLVDGASVYGYAPAEFVPALMAAAAFAGRSHLWGALSDWLFDDGCYTLDEYLRDLALDLALGPLGKAVGGKLAGALGRAAGNIPPSAMRLAANGTDSVATGAAARAAGAIRRFAADESGAVALGRASKIRDASLAGSTHPRTGVPFDKDGFPNFSAYRHPDVPDVRIELSGSRPTDFARANAAAGLKNTPPGYTWHHHQDRGLMQLVDKDVHRYTGHTGGFNSP